MKASICELCVQNRELCNEEVYSAQNVCRMFVRKYGNKPTVKKILIVKAPFAQWIVEGIKTLEMRSRETKIRETIGIAESGTGLILGTVELYGSMSMTPEELRTTKELHCVDDFELLKKWNKGWMLRNPVKFENPLKYNHPQGSVVWVDAEKNRINI